jgi:hypothetical protein
VSSGGKSRDNGQGGKSFAERLSPLIAQGGKKRGVIPVPGLLVHYQGRLGLSDGELVYILHVLAEKRGRDWPYLGVSDTAKEMLRHERNARSLKQSLEERGFLVCRPMWKADGTRGGDEHDLSGLFAELERLAIELGTQEALDQVRAEQPEPMYYRGQIQMATTPPNRLRRAVRRRKRMGNDEANDEANTAADAFARNRGGGGENATTPLAKMPPPGRRIRHHPAGENATTRPANSPAQSEVRSQRSEPEVLTEVTQTGLAPAPRAPGRRRLTETDVIEPAEDDRAGAPMVDGRPTDPGIAYRVDEWAAEFGDNDPARTLRAVTHWWWSSHLEPGDVANAMKAASHATRKRARRGLHQPPVAYAMAVLHTELSMRCVAQGLPPLPGGPDSEQLDARQLRARVERVRRELARLPEQLNNRTRAGAQAMVGELARLEAELNELPLEKLELAPRLDALKPADRVDRSDAAQQVAATARPKRSRWPTGVQFLDDDDDQVEATQRVDAAARPKRRPPVKERPPSARREKAPGVAGAA